MHALPISVPRVLLALLLAAGTVACSHSWESDAISARIVDASTGSPVVGAIVMVNWQLQSAEGSRVGQAAIFERTTDANGAFQTPAWGPVKSHRLAILDGNQPVVHVFKRGYEPLTVGNFSGAPGQDAVQAERHIRPHVNGQTLRLRPFTGSLQEYSQQLNDFWSGLAALNGTSCDWGVAPHLFRALSEMKEEFLRGDVTSDLQLERSLCRRGAAQR